MFWRTYPRGESRRKHPGVLIQGAGRAEQRQAEDTLANDILFALGRMLLMRVRLAKARSQQLAFSWGG